MPYRLQDLPLQARRGRRAAATAFALAVAGAWQPALLPAQVAEVEVVTTGTQAAAGATTPTAQTSAAAPGETNLDEAASKIVPAPGTVLQSTENSALQTGQAVAPAPSLTISQDQMVLKEGETTESVAVRSGVELLRMLGVKKQETATTEEGLESEEDQASELFDVSAVRRLKGEEPTVVYRVVVDNKPLPDPMIVPWIRQAKLLQERFDKAVAMLSENKVTEGRDELLGIITDFPDTDYAIQAREIIKKLDELSQSEIPQPVVAAEPETTVTVELSPNVAVGTVIVDPEDPSGNRAMIGGRAYAIGDEIKGEVGHTVTGITETVVQVEVEQSGVKKTFDIPVRPTGVNNR